MDGNIDLDGHTSAGNNYSDIALIKYNISGVKQWTKQLGGESIDKGYSVGIDSNDNIYITGFAIGELNGISGSGMADVVLAKYNTDGTRLWTRLLGSNLTDYGTALAIDSLDNIYLTGYTEGSLEGYSVRGIRDVLLIKYNSSGEKQWMRQF